MTLDLLTGEELRSVLAELETKQSEVIQTQNQIRSLKTAQYDREQNQRIERKRIGCRRALWLLYGMTGCLPVLLGLVPILHTAADELTRRTKIFLLLLSAAGIVGIAAAAKKQYRKKCAARAEQQKMLSVQADEQAVRLTALTEQSDAAQAACDALYARYHMQQELRSARCVRYVNRLLRSNATLGIFPAIEAYNETVYRAQTLKRKQENSTK